MLDHRAELNRINVFPVPDGDTGTNLAMTLRAMANAVAEFHDRSVTRVAHRLAEAGVEGARGNSGMMLSHFFLGFAQALGERGRAQSQDLGPALQDAVGSLYRAVEEPVEGTLLTVVREATDEVQEVCRNAGDLKQVAACMLESARASLARTPELLPQLRDAHVVDAGAKGFVRFLEGVVGLIEGAVPGDTRFLVDEIDMTEAAGASRFARGDGQGLRYCAEYLIRAEPPPPQAEMAAAVRKMGDSLIVTRASRLAKIHIHTDRPEDVERALSELGSRVERVKVEDMRAQHRARQERLRRTTAIVTDSTCDLPPELLIEHDITVVPLTVSFGERSYRDQVEITHEEFLSRLTDPEQPDPTTSQPTPADLERAYHRAAELADEVLGLFVAGALSGTLGQAQAVASRYSEADVRADDSRTASLALGFQVLHAAELAAAGRDRQEIIAELDALRPNSGLLVTLDTLDYLRRSGRVGRAKAYLAGVFDLKPIVGLDQDGVLIPIDRVRGREALMERVVELLRERIPTRRCRLRLGVIHVACPDLAETLSARLEEEFGPDQMLVRPGTGVLAAHTGPGAWAVAYQVEPDVGRRPEV